jgi:hypothetical protein
MTAKDAIAHFDRVSKEFAGRRSSAGTLVPGILRVPRPFIELLRGCTRDDWEPSTWRIFECELRVFHHGGEYEVADELKRMENAAGVPVVSIRIVDAGDVEIAPIFAEELATYLRALPDLLAAGAGGKYAVIAGDKLALVVDRYEDALEYGYEKFGAGGFMAHQIDPRDRERLAFFLGDQGAVCRS